MIILKGELLSRNIWLMIIITLNGDNDLNRLEQSDIYTQDYNRENRYNLSFIVREKSKIKLKRYCTG